MNKKPNATKAGRRTPANEKAPSVAVAKGQKNRANNNLDFSELLANTQGKRCTLGIVADLQLHPTDVVRQLVTNLDALKALKLADVLKVRYIVLGGHLMTEKAGAFAISIPDDHNAHALLALAVGPVNGRLAKMSDVTMWTLLVNEADSQRLKPIIGAGGASA